MAAPGDMMTVRLHGRFDGEPIINDIGFGLNTDFGSFPLAAAALVSELDTALGTSSGGGPWLTALSNAYTLEIVEVVDVLPGTSASFQSPSGYPGAQEGSDAMPPNDALAVSLRSVYKGPGGRGRMYISGWPESDAAGGYWTGDAQAAAQTICAALNSSFGELGTGSFRWSIIHRYSNGGVLHAPVVKLATPELKPVVDWTVHNEVRSLGRRAVGRRIRRVRSA